MDEGKAPFLLQIARLERMVRVQRSEIDLMDETITKRGNLLEVKNVELLVLHHRLQVGSDV
jgi:DNA-binding sugar fermentation-stimulating protein